MSGLNSEAGIKIGMGIATGASLVATVFGSSDIESSKPLNATPLPTHIISPTRTQNTATMRPTSTAAPTQISRFEGDTSLKSLTMEEYYKQEERSFKKPEKIGGKGYVIHFDATDERSLEMKKNKVEKSVADAIQFIKARFGITVPSETHFFLKAEEHILAATRNGEWPVKPDSQFPCAVPGYIVISNISQLSQIELRNTVVHELMHLGLMNTVGLIPRQSENSDSRTSYCGSGVALEESWARLFELMDIRSNSTTQLPGNPFFITNFVKPVELNFKLSSLNLSEYGQWGFLQYLVEHHAKGSSNEERLRSLFSEYTQRIVGEQKKYQTDASHVVQSDALLLELIQQSNDPELKKAESVEQAVLYVMAKGIYDERAFGGAEIYKNASKKYAVEKVNLPIKQEGITVVKIPNALWQIRELDFSERKKPKSIDTNLMVTLVAVTEEGTRVIQGENDQSGFVHFKIPPGTTKVLTVVRADNPNEKNQNSGALDLVINN